MCFFCNYGNKDRRPFFSEASERKASFRAFHITKDETDLSVHLILAVKKLCSSSL
ncbi:hypothetical protein HMPREF1986_01673 [Oribacterium sp. oral taxon 078 str. F0263]|nr:hypothetical protein HMPREF1986_01673 [Oribacterium sp. oral taxon 078 str. F0263]